MEVPRIAHPLHDGLLHETIQDSKGPLKQNGEECGEIGVDGATSLDDAWLPCD